MMKRIQNTRSRILMLSGFVLFVLLALLWVMEGKPWWAARTFSLMEHRREMAGPWQDWDKPIDSKELEAYEYAHSLRLPESVPQPVPFDFSRYDRENFRVFYKAYRTKMWKEKGWFQFVLMVLFVDFDQRVQEEYDKKARADYFDHLCKTEAGEYIFKVIDKVEGLYQMRQRHQATVEEFGSLYKMEDPYGYVEGEAEEVPFMFVKSHRYNYFEMSLPDSFVNMKEIYKKYYDESLFYYPKYSDVSAIFYGYDRGQELTSMKKIFSSKRRSRYGYTWRGIRREHDRGFGIAGGELIVMDLQTQEILGVRRGFARTGARRGRTSWEFTPVCPRYEIRDRSKDFDFSYWFIRKVLRPVDSVEWPDLTF